MSFTIKPFIKSTTIAAGFLLSSAFYISAQGQERENHKPCIDFFPVSEKKMAIAKDFWKGKPEEKDTDFLKKWVRSRIGNEGETTLVLPDLTSHPLAGRGATIRITPFDALQKGESKIIECLLPAYPFISPLSKKLAKIRGDLAQESINNSDLEKFLISIKRVSDNYHQFIKTNIKNIDHTEIEKRLHNIDNKFKNAQTITKYNEILNDLWPVILLLEENHKTEARKLLEKAFKDLQETFSPENKLSDKEIKELYKEALKALEKFLKEQIKQAKKNGDQDLQKKLEDIEKTLQKLKESIEKTPQIDKNALDKMMSQLKDAMKMQDMQNNDSSSQQSQPNQNNNKKSQTASESQQQQDLRKKFEKRLKDMQRQAAQKAQQQQMKNDLKKIIQEQKDLLQKSAKEAQQQKENMKQLTKDIEKHADDLNNHIEKKKQKDNQNKSTLEKLQRDTTKISKDIKEKRKKDQSLTHKEAESMINKMRDIQKQLSPNSSEQNHEKNSVPKNKQQQQQQQQRNETLENALEQLKKQIKQQNPSLSEKQKKLQEELQQFMDKMKKMGLKPKSLKEADKPMEKSHQKLQQGNPKDAIPNQNEALQKLQEGQKQMQQQMQQQSRPGNNPGQGEGEGPGEGTEGGQGRSTKDPSGKLNNEAGKSIEQNDPKNQVRDIRDKIRDMLSDPNLSPENKRYLENLEKQNTPLPRP